MLDARGTRIRHPPCRARSQTRLGNPPRGEPCLISGRRPTQPFPAQLPHHDTVFAVNRELGDLSNGRVSAELLRSANISALKAIAAAANELHS